MRLEQLLYIVEVADKKSISKAAKNLYISQPSLSKAIALLEGELQTQIFIRHQHGITLTTDGEQIVQKARNILEQINDIEKIASTSSLSNESIILNVSFPLILCNDIFINILLDIQKQYPSIRIIPYQKDTDSTIHSLKKGTLNFGIISYSSIEKSKIEDICRNNHFINQTLSKEDFYVVVRKNHCLSGRKIVDYKELDEFSLVTFSDLVENNPLLYSQKCTYIPNFDTIDNLLLNSDDITILPRIGAMTCKGVRQRMLTAIPIANFSQQQYIGLLFDSYSPFTIQSQIFINLFSETYAQTCLF